MATGVRYILYHTDDIWNCRQRQRIVGLLRVALPHEAWACRQFLDWFNKLNRLKADPDFLIEVNVVQLPPDSIGWFLIFNVIRTGPIWYEPYELNGLFLFSFNTILIFNNKIKQ